MTTIYRTVGDYGELARIRVLDLQDMDGNPITSGDVRLRAARLFDRAMTHLSNGTWYLDLQEGDLDRQGSYPLEVRVNGSRVTVPSEEPWTLMVRNTVRDP